MSSSLPNHDAKVGKKQTKKRPPKKKKREKTQGQTTLDTVRAKTI